MIDDLCLGSLKHHLQCPSFLQPLLSGVKRGQTDVKDRSQYSKCANLPNYTDDNQIYFSDRDPKVGTSVINKLVPNPGKCKMYYPSKNVSLQRCAFTTHLRCLILLTVL